MALIMHEFSLTVAEIGSSNAGMQRDLTRTERHGRNWMRTQALLADPVLVSCTAAARLPVRKQTPALSASGDGCDGPRRLGGRVLVRPPSPRQAAAVAFTATIEPTSTCAGSVRTGTRRGLPHRV